VISLKKVRVRAVSCGMQLRCMVCSLIALWADGGILPAKCLKDIRVWNEGRRGMPDVESLTLEGCWQFDLLVSGGRLPRVGLERTW
jgi:hypothetical protein